VDDLKGRRFGRLVVLGRASVPGGAGKHIRWDCICDCGNSHSAKSSNLKVGNVLSCGCLCKEKARKEIKPGTVFGRWAVIALKAPHPKKDGNGNELVYLCLCRCGNKKIIRGSKLRNGRSKSCGCYSAELTAERSFIHGLTGTKEYQATACSNRRARLKNAEGNYTQQEIGRLYSSQKGLCFYCKISLIGDFHRDHKIPLSRGGSNWISNIALTCPKCNTRKNTKTDVEFAQVLEGEQ